MRWGGEGEREGEAETTGNFNLEDALGGWGSIHCFERKGLTRSGRRNTPGESPPR
jgi:hypothetical protein